MVSLAKFTKEKLNWKNKEKSKNKRKTKSTLVIVNYLKLSIILFIQ